MDAFAEFERKGVQNLSDQFDEALPVHVTPASLLSTSTISRLSAMRDDSASDGIRLSTFEAPRNVTTAGDQVPEQMMIPDKE